MSTRGFPIRGLAAAITLAALAACADDRSTGPTGPSRNVAPGEWAEPTHEEAAPAPVPAPAYDVVRGPEADFIALAQEIPGFGGYAYEGGDRVVYLTDLSQQSTAEATLQSSDAATAEVSDGSAHTEEQKTGTTRYVQAAYDFMTLRDYRDRSAPSVLDVSGVVSVDLDEKRNRLVVGVTGKTAHAEVEHQLLKHGVPLAAVIIEGATPVELNATLRDRRRPLVGGLQITNGWNGSRCTLGFVTQYGDAPAFVTASHCTNAVWAQDGVSFFQPTVLDGNQAGGEVADPAGWACGWQQCRWSDAAVVQISGGASGSLGYVARTVWSSGPTFGPWAPIEIDESSSLLRINSKQNHSRVGDVVDKMGRTSGWTYGVVTRSCVDVNVGARRLLCQDYATYTSVLGDSGAPVFVWHGNTANTVKLTGIHWGSNGYEAIYSPIWSIESDLGPLTVR